MQRTEDGRPCERPPLRRRYTQDALLEDLEKYRASIDFFYLPTDFKNQCNLGSAARLGSESVEVRAQFRLS